MESLTTLKPLPARFDGVQRSLAPGLHDFELYTIWEAIPGHPYGSTLSIDTINALGYEPVETQEPQS